MAPMFNKVVIVGMGLMGGSLGLTLLDKKIARSVTGLGRNYKRLEIARKKGAATDVATDYKTAITGADLVVISLPVMMITRAFKEMKPFLSKNTIVTDMGSVKGAIVEKIRLFDTAGNFVGSHPMVGSEKAGIEFMKEGLYDKGTCIVTPGPGTNAKISAKVIKFWKAAGMNVMKMTPAEHDACTAAVSHFPHMAAFAMVVSHEKEISKNKRAIGPGFRDATRIGASNEELWSEILIMNKKEVLKNVKAYVKHLAYLAGMIEKNSLHKLKEYIKKSRILRESIK